MTVTSSEAPPSSSLERAALVLEAFDGCGPLTLTEIVQRVGLPRSSTHRMLDKLVAMHWLSRDGNRYDLGLRMFEIGTLVKYQHQARKAAQPFLHELHRATGLIVHFAVLDGDDVVFLERIGGRPMSPSGRVGGRLPAHCTSLGKVLLAYAEPAPEPGPADRLRGLTPRSITRGSALAAELAAVRERGYAASRDEAVVGVACVAVPVGGRHDAAVGAISVGGATGTVSVESVVPALRLAAHHAYQALQASRRGRADGTPTIRPA